MIVYDWERFQPLVKHIMERYKVPVNPYENFEWLATETRRFLQGSGKIHPNEAPASASLNIPKEHAIGASKDDR